MKNAARELMSLHVRVDGANVVNQASISLQKGIGKSLLGVLLIGDARNNNRRRVKMDCEHCWCQTIEIMGMIHDVCCMCKTRRMTKREKP